MGEGDRAEIESAEMLNDPATQKALFEDAYRLARAQLDNHAHEIGWLCQINQSRNALLADVTTAFASEYGAECGSGCSFCCHQMVLCTPLEIFEMAHHILVAKPESEIAEIKERLTQRAPLPLDEQSRHGADKPCALLRENCCSIYEHRPSLCRTMLSTSRAACEVSLNGREQTVPFIAEPVVIAFLMQLGIDHAFIKQKHVSTEKVEMSRALSIALETFDIAFQNWLDGEDAFPNCHPEQGNAPSNADLVEMAAARLGSL